MAVPIWQSTGTPLLLLQLLITFWTKTGYQPLVGPAQISAELAAESVQYVDDKAPEYRALRILRLEEKTASESRRNMRVVAYIINLQNRAPNISNGVYQKTSLRRDSSAWRDA